MEPHQFSPDTVVQRRTDVLEASVDDDLILLSLEENAYFGAGATGKAIWEHLATPIPVGQLVDALLEEYEVDRGVCHEQTVSFLVQLDDAGLLRVA